MEEVYFEFALAAAHIIGLTTLLLLALIKAIWILERDDKKETGKNTLKQNKKR